MKRLDVKYPDGWDNSWPGKIVTCRICNKKFWMFVGVYDTKVEHYRHVCDDCFTELEIIRGTEDDVHKVVDENDSHY